MSLSEQNQREQTQAIIAKLITTEGMDLVEWLAEHFVMAAQLLVLQKQVIDMRSEGDVLLDQDDEQAMLGCDLHANANALENTIKKQVEYITDLYRAGWMS